MRARPVVVGVPNWNGGDLTLACLRSLERVESPSLQVVVVDNGSRDGSVAAIRSAHSDVRIVELGENTGFAGAANVALDVARAAGADYALLLNSDAVVAEDAIALLVEALEAHPDAAAAGPTIYFADRPQVIWSSGGRIDWRRGETGMLGLDEIDRGQFGDQPRAVPFVTGCAMLLRLRATERVGSFDPRFFAYYEEVDWCVRSGRLGWTILHVPRARAWHRLSAEEREASPLVQYYMTRNRLLFLRSAGAPVSAWLHALLSDDVRTLLSWSLRPKWRHKRPLRAAVVRALIDFGMGRFGRAPLAGA